VCILARAQKRKRWFCEEREEEKLFLCGACVKKRRFDGNPKTSPCEKNLERVFAPKNLGNTMLRKERELCYKHRDAYYEALSSSSSSSNNSENKRELKRLKKLFEKYCPSSWVEHFEKIRLDQEKFANLTKEEEKEKS
jgi:hypothetical protein